MSNTFPRTRKSRRGYNVDQVEEFLEDARVAYSAEASAPGVISADTIRHTAFGLQKGGYSPTHVDAALERLEDAFATRERDHSRQLMGDAAWFTAARTQAREIIDRLGRHKGSRFRRAGFLTTGYDRAQVDAFAKRLESYFTDGTPLSVESVRSVAFRPRKRGYQETQVDVFLDAVIKVMLAVR